MTLESLKTHIADIQQTFLTKLATTKQSGKFDDLFLEYFSKKHGLLTKLLKTITDYVGDEKKEAGVLLNSLQNEIKNTLARAKEEYQTSVVTEADIDLSVPVKPKKTGQLHPTTQVIRELDAFFNYYGFSVAEAQEIETLEYNFRKLNLPEGHPATDLQDTLFVAAPDLLLRTHTSSIEARTLTNFEPPIRVAMAGRVYRNETLSATNSSFFHQYQGVVVDKGITLQNLMHTIVEFHKFLFKQDVEVRFRYKFYPEVSPGLGADMKCLFCHGAGCTACKFRGWVEVLGSGMIHYNTLKMCNIDPEVYTGFAFGIGLDRFVMQRFLINDIRLLYGGGIIYV